LTESRHFLQQLRLGLPLTDGAARLSARELVDMCRPTFLSALPPSSADPGIGVRWLEFMVGVLQLPSSGLVLPEVADAVADAAAVLLSLAEFAVANS
jgi:hypothetical protein